MNIEDIKTLDNLKSEAEAINAIIKEKKEHLKIQEKKNVAIVRAEKEVDAEISRLQNKEEIIQNILKEYPVITAINENKIIKRTPYTYFGLEKWTGLDVEKETTVTKLLYKGIKLILCDDNTIDIPYHITGIMRTYKLKTALKKIDDYDDKQNKEKIKKLNQERALKDAANYLKRTILQRKAKAEVIHSKSGKLIPDFSTRGKRNIWKEDDILTVNFENGSRLKYRVDLNGSGDFKLSLLEFVDARINDIKKDPILSIKHLM